MRFYPSMDEKSIVMSKAILVKGKTDVIGNQKWKDEDGNTIDSRTGIFGNKVFTDEKGNKMRC